MNKAINPVAAGLHAKDQVIQKDTNHYVLFIDRKTRIVMADAGRILKKVELLCRKFPEAKISIETTAPVCSKTRQYFKEHNIDFN